MRKIKNDAMCGVTLFPRSFLLFKITSVLATSLFIQGCVGVVTRGMDTKTFSPTMIAKDPNIYSVSTIDRPSDTKIEDPTNLWLKEHWGEPSRVRQMTRSTNSESWTYNFDHKWCGVIFWAVMPIPVLLPVGRECVVFHIRDGKVTGADVTTLCGYEAMAGVIDDDLRPTVVFGRWD